MAPVASAATCQTGSVKFSFTGAEQCYVVPVGVTTVHVVAIGAPGSSGALDAAILGGAGGEATADLSVTPGETLFVEVGGLGTSGDFGDAGTGGFNGGGNGGAFVGGGGGGGASDVRTVSCGTCTSPDPASLQSRLLIAGGGGGAGGDSLPGSGRGGAAGQPGADGTTSSGHVAGGGGGGAGTPAAGGAGGGASGCGGAAGSAGASGQGGAAGTGNSGAGGGGGGGGLFGGGGGGSASDNQGCSAGGGGGGSSFGPAGTTYAVDMIGNPSVMFAVPPTASISFPPSGATYALGQLVGTSFSCSDAAPSSTGPIIIGLRLVSCNDSTGTNTDLGGMGSLDTSTTGTHTYIVTAKTDDGATGTTSITYTVAVPPTAAITSPASGGRYSVGERVPTAFACSEGASGSGLASCDDSSGTNTVSGGSGHLDTSRPGFHRYVVTARSRDGLTAVTNVTYTVVQSLRIVSSSAFWVNGKAAVKLACHRGTAGGVCRGMLTLSIRKAVHHGNKVAFVIVVLARHTYSVPAGRTRKVTLKLSAALLLRAPHPRLSVRATATVSGGGPTVSRVITLHL